MLLVMGHTKSFGGFLLPEARKLSESTIGVLEELKRNEGMERSKVSSFCKISPQ